MSVTGRLIKNFCTSIAHKQWAKGLIAPEKIQNPAEIEKVERLLKNLEQQETDKGEWPQDNCWHYGPHEEAWDELCKPGEYQSPIDIVPKATVKSSDIFKESYFPLSTRYIPISTQGRFTTKTFLVQGNFGSLTINTLLDQPSRTFDAAQFHFHSPAEHLLNGKRNDLELHIVHKERDKPTNMSVLGFFFQNDGIRNPFIDQVIKSLDKPTPLDLNLLFPKTKLGIYLYEGSLTTPPLFQGILWFLISNLQSINTEQLDFFKSQWEKNPEFAGGKGNYREVQPLNNRPILYFD